MPKIAREMGPLEVKRLVHPGGKGNVTHTVGGVNGLQLQITPNGARSWVLRTTVGDTRRNIGLGSYPTVTLGQAREAARETHELVRKGIDPVAQKRALRSALARSVTFAQAMEQFLAVKLKEFANEKHRKQWRATLDKYAIPLLGQMPVDQIDVQDILRALCPIWEEKTETASRLRGRIEQVLNWAAVNGHRTGDNPARWKGNLDALLPKPSKVAKVQHHPALALADVPDWFADLRARDGMAARALEFAAATAARSGEVRGATWAEIDLDAALWTIPAPRMKMKVEHREPLTREAVELLRSLPRIVGSDFVFPAPRGGMSSDMALSKCMGRINAARPGGYLDPRTGRPAVPHGLRSSFKDWSAEKGYPNELSEIALAHAVGSAVERAYRRTDMVERRRQMMAHWGAFLRGEERGDVIELGAAR